MQYNIICNILYYKALYCTFSIRTTMLLNTTLHNSLIISINHIDPNYKINLINHIKSTHTGSDFCRSLLLFNKEKKLGENGLFWLKVHLSNLFGNNKIPHHERVAFVDENMDKIIATAADPLGMQNFWGEADEPFQALATILGMIMILLNIVLFQN